MKNLGTLNKEFSVAGRLEFVTGKGGMILAEMRCPPAKCAVSIYGGHVLSFMPDGRNDVLWMSASSFFEKGRPIRGGIPVCWPWFGAHPSDKSMPSHGFARISDWIVKSASCAGEDFTELVLSLDNSCIDPERFNVQPFNLELAVRCGKSLELELITENRGTEEFTVSEALHSYLAVSEIGRIAVSGLDGAGYIETAGGIHERRTQSGDVTFDREVDRVYCGSTADCIISDPGLGRSVKVSKAGSRTTVVWNPWIAKSAKMPDFGDDEYLSMVCVETANAADDALRIPPGGMHGMRLRLQTC